MALTARLALESVRKRFGTRVVLDALSFAVDDGEMLTVLGPSGAGKTTLLRAIAGLERLDGGRIALAGRDVTTAPAAERGIGFVFQDYALFPHLTVRANIAFGMRERGAAARRGRVVELAERLHIASLLDRLPARLSGGERQRVAVARALATRPAALLFDEPFASLDAPLRLALRAELAGLRGTAGIATIFVTHDADEALALGDRVALIEAGRLTALATPAELTAAPPTVFAARVAGRPPAIVLEGATRGGAFAVDGEPGLRRSGVAAGTTALALRPEAIRVVPRDGDASGIVRIVETIGMQRYATVALATRLVTALAAADTRVGQRVALAFDFRAAWQYDGRGRRVA